MLEEKGYEMFGSMVFSDEVLKKRVTKDVYTRYHEIIDSSEALDKLTADAIAKAMKEWALEKGCTHFTHWFHPLTGTTAEKHDAFINIGDDGEPILKFDGKTLIKGEPDASSFPSGGLRSTFEARGYTYWDLSSPAFIRDGVLCIPSVFVSYYGESLDKKGPLLKSIGLVSEKATKLLNMIGYEDVKKVTPMVGLEQEYFLIDRPLYKERTDLVLTGHTLFGHSAPKGQEFEDHYFGAIPTRVQAFMKEVNVELWKLGIYAKTEHNEVAPRQFELAPLFADANIAVDQNQLIMDILKRVAHRHGFACLLHEKPFDGINGSGKHNNYSLVSNTGLNVFEPGKTPEEIKRFALFVACFVKGVDTYPELLRIAAANPGNDFRLGCNEAPPAIISIFLGDYIEDLIAEYYGGEKKGSKKAEKIDGFSYISTDNTDRNRTSPVAFTGNKFEFRMLGSSASAAMPNVVLDTLMADAIDEVIARLEKVGPAKYEDEIKKYVSEVFAEHSKVIYGANGYSKEWVEEAARRGLPNLTSSIEAISHLDDEKNVSLLTRTGIYTVEEIEARKSVWAEQYLSTISLDVKTLLYMAESYVIPALSTEIEHYLAITSTSKFAAKRLDKLVYYLDTLGDLLEDLKTKYARLDDAEDEMVRGKKMHDEIVPLMSEVRAIIDAYEKISSKETYKLPTYPKMLY